MRTSPAAPEESAATSGSPWSRYQSDLARPGFIADPAQAKVVKALERLYRGLTQADLMQAAPQAVPATGLARLGMRLGLWRGPEPDASPRAARQRGLYIWGGVGRGKTYLMDCFAGCLPPRQVLRQHFHRFMQDIHARLRALGEVPRPLAIVAAQLASECRILCLDEFHVGDITDAMLLAGLLDALFTAGVVLVTTSNEAPGDLYRGGLQRARFLPAIALIERHCEVVLLDSPNDHRLRTLEQATLYFSSHAGDTAPAMRQLFEQLAGEEGYPGEVLNVEGRDIQSVVVGQGVAWFDYQTLFVAPRAAADYIEIARCFHSVFVSGLPVLGEADADPVRRFITAVDEFYDRRVKLVLAAAAPLMELYQGERLQTPFQRTLSRLLEMQSHDYLAEPHRSD